jgi:hypothetical protein
MSIPAKKRPRDPNQLGKLIAAIAVGDEPDAPTTTADPKAVARGRLGGLKGGAARKAALSDTQRAEIAKKAALARWKKKGP